MRCAAMPVFTTDLPTYVDGSDFGEYVRAAHQLQITHCVALRSELSSLRVLLSNAAHPDDTKCTVTTLALVATVGEKNSVFDFRVFGIMVHTGGYCPHPAERLKLAAESFAAPDSAEFFLELWRSSRLLVMGELARDVVVRAFASGPELAFPVADSSEILLLEYADHLSRVKSVLQKDRTALEVNYEVWKDFLGDENFMSFKDWLAKLKEVPKTQAQMHAASNHAITDRVRENCAVQGRLYGASNGLASQNPVSIAKRVASLAASNAAAGVKRRTLASRMKISQVKKELANGPQKEELKAINSERAVHMLDARDQDLTDERRRATAALARASNSFVPESYNASAHMVAQGVQATLHEMCEPYVKRDFTLPEGAVVEGVYGPRGSWAEQKQREAARVRRVALIAADDRVLFGQLRAWGYSVDHIMLFSPGLVLYDDVVMVMSWPKRQKELMALTGKAAAVSGEDPAAWHTDDELRAMVAAMTRAAQTRVIDGDVAVGSPATRDPELYGRRRLACLLMHVARRANSSKSSAKEVGLYHFWVDYVDHRVGGSLETWRHARYGWNPSKFEAGAHKKLYAAVLQQHDAEVLRHNAEVERKRLQFREEEATSKRAKT